MEVKSNRHKYKSISIAIPIGEAGDELHSALCQIKDKEGRTMSQTVVRILIEYVAWEHAVALHRGAIDG